MESKFTRAINLLQRHITILSCPICESSMRISDGAIKCEEGHTFDISKKGYVNFFGGHSTENYPRELFEARRRVFESGLYDPLIDVIKSELANVSDDASILDAGCGEGYLLNTLQSSQSSKSVGIDLSKDAISLATDFPCTWFIADIADTPFAADSFDYVLNILSPANYKEFKRILKPGGKLIKVLPGKKYLQEIRDFLGMHETDSSTVELLEKKLDITASHNIFFTKEINKDTMHDLVAMTPMTHKKTIASISFSKITIDLEVYFCQ